MPFSWRARRPGTPSDGQWKGSTTEPNPDYSTDAEAATKIPAEVHKEAVRRLRDSPTGYAHSDSAEPQQVRAEAVQVSRAVLRSMLQQPAPGDTNVTRPYRGAVANVAAGCFWQARAHPDDIIKALDTAPFPAKQAPSRGSTDQRRFAGFSCTPRAVPGRVRSARVPITIMAVTGRLRS